jgi:hypothetical protein
MVRQLDFEDGVVVRRLVLQSFNVTGLGFFPLIQGNSWQYGDESVGASSSSVGALKARFSGGD